DDINLELYGQNVIVAVFGMGERSMPEAARLVHALRDAARRVGTDPHGEKASFAAPPPWGELAMTPREAYLGAQEVVPADEAVGRIAAESLATYPPGIPNVLPGERLTAETLAYIRGTLELGGWIGGAGDRQLRTVRVVGEWGGCPSGAFFAPPALACPGVVACFLDGFGSRRRRARFVWRETLQLLLYPVVGGP